jgi:predicted porin
MNKKLIAAAIAAAVAAPTAALANDVTIYGVMHASIDYRTDDFTVRGTALDSSTSPWGPTNTISGSYEDNGLIDGFDIASRASRIGFKGTEDLANGLKAIWKVEMQVDIADSGACGGYSTGPYGGQSPTLGQGGVGASPNVLAARGEVRAWTSPLTGGTPGSFQGGWPAVSVSNGGTAPKCTDQSSALWTARNAYIGLAGGWGTALVGRHDTPYKMTTQKLDLFADTLADWNSTIGLVDLRTGSAIAYVSPSFAGLSFAGAIVAPHVYSTNLEFAGVSADADSLAEAYSLALTYDANGFFGSIAYENVSGEWVKGWAGDTFFNSGSVKLNNIPSTFPISNLNGTGVYNVLKNGSVDIDDNEKLRIGLGWTGMGFTIGGVYEWEDNLIGYNSGTDATRWQVSAGYTFGNTMVKAMYGQGEFSTGTVCYDCNNASTYWNRDSVDYDSSAWALGLDHNLSKRTKAYVLYTNVDYDYNYQQDRNGFVTNDTWEPRLTSKNEGTAGGWSLGLIHNF